MLTIDMKGKTTVVIGGSRGIGAAVVEMSAGAGSNVAWTCPDLEKDISECNELEERLRPQGVGTHHAIVDCTDAVATVGFVADVIERFGALDHLVYCAGFTSPVPYLDLTIEEWKRVVDINLNGAFIATHTVIPQMKAQGGGVIVMVGSAAVVAGGGGRADYVSSKAGMEGLNRAITKEFAPSRIRCNVVHPSLIETDLLKQRHPDPRKREELAQQVPLRRLGQPEDIGHAVMFLLSDMASYITGQSLFVDGGRTFCK